MNVFNQHYRALLGLDDSWTVEDVDLDLIGGQVQIRLRHRGGALFCPECGASCPQADTASQRTWRHLDTMQFKTEIHAAVPRCHCEACGVKTVSVPWAGKHSSFTLLFEALAIRVILAAANTKKGAGLLGISWNAAHRIMQASVQRGLTRREAEPVAHVGIDEKSFGKGQDYMTIMTGIDRSRVLDVAPERTTAARDSLWKSLTSEQLDSVQAVAMDMWQAFMKNHLDGLLNYRDHRVTNATSKGFNSWIQSIKSAARGFRNFANYRIRILFHCGKLEMTP